MTIGAIVDVGIGLIFTYLLLSLIATSIQEIISGIVQSRGNNLRDGLRTILILAVPAEQASPPRLCGLFTGLATYLGVREKEPAAVTGGATDPASLFKTVYSHALVTQASTTQLPSYVSARNFTTALFDVLRAGSSGPLFDGLKRAIGDLPESPIRQSLEALLAEAGDDLGAFRKRVETWYDDAMDRVSGAYKRNAQVVTLIIGLAIAVAGNVDSIVIVEALWTDPTARAAITAEAEAWAKANTGTTPDTRAQAAMNRALLDSLPIPMGWRTQEVPIAVKKPCAAGEAPPSCDPPAKTGVGAVVGMVLGWIGAALWKIIGWLITAIAISFGAPFWFDLLKQVINIRATGPKPTRADHPAASGSRT